MLLQDSTGRKVRVAGQFRMFCVKEAPLFLLQSIH